MVEFKVRVRVKVWVRVKVRFRVRLSLGLSLCVDCDRARARARARVRARVRARARVKARVGGVTCATIDCTEEGYGRVAIIARSISRPPARSLDGGCDEKDGSKEGCRWW